MKCLKNRIFFVAVALACFMFSQKTSAFDGIPTEGTEFSGDVFGIVEIKSVTKNNYWSGDPDNTISSSIYNSFVTEKMEELRAGNPDAFISLKNSPVKETHQSTDLKFGIDFSEFGVSFLAFRTWSWISDRHIDADADALFRITEELGRSPKPKSMLSFDLGTIIGDDLPDCNSSDAYC